MKNDTIHIIGNEFSRGIGQSLEWWKYRLSLYEHYTLNSIVNQTNQNFYLMMLVDYRFPLKEELEKILKCSGLKYLLIDKSVEGDFEDKMNTMPDFKYVFSTRIDSDDLFRKDAVEEIQCFEYSWRRALVFQKGYCYDCIDNRLQHYKVQSPPNTTIMYPKDVFLDETKRREYLDIHGHDQVFSELDSIVLSENKYMILVHKHNRRSVYVVGEQATELGRLTIPENEHEDILKDFNINNKTHKKVWKE
ncbi:MAG: putative rhamnosyl transferase [Patescibacteria group bacterium]|nr:putative rhamnosyl transferase [Patescibacteria group bacterium]MCP6727505.1 putative rhamnosyl transferase [Patescibacteria group bacterium]